MEFRRNQRRNVEINIYLRTCFITTGCKVLIRFVRIILIIYQIYLKMVYGSSDPPYGY